MDDLSGGAPVLDAARESRSSRRLLVVTVGVAACFALAAGAAVAGAPTASVAPDDTVSIRSVQLEGTGAGGRLPCAFPAAEEEEMWGLLLSDAA